MNAGDTLLINEPGTSLDSHLWIVISDPSLDAEHIVLVNLTSHRDDKDQACVLDCSDHPYIQHKTCIEYKRAKVVSLQKLQPLIDSGIIDLKEPCSNDLLIKIRNGVVNSLMPLEIVEILIALGVVEI